MHYLALSFHISGNYVRKLLNFCASTLTSLDVSGCFQVTEEVLHTVLEKCPNLRRLNVKNCRKLTNNFLDDILTFPSLTLQELNFGGNFNINDVGIRNFVRNYRNIHMLENFGFSGLEVQDETISLIGQKCFGLKVLEMAYLDVREATLADLLASIGRQLEKLDIAWLSTTPNAKNAQPAAKFIVDTLCTNCPLLTELDLTANRNLQLPHIQELVDRKLSLQVMNIFGSDYRHLILIYHCHIFIFKKFIAIVYSTREREKPWKCCTFDSSRHLAPP